MKTFKVNFAVLAVLVTTLFSNLAFATNPEGGDDEEKVAITSTKKFAYNVFALKNSLKFKVAFKNASEDKITVRILDTKGTLIYKDILKDQEALNRNYDMRNIGAGIYKVQIEMGDLKAENEIAVGVSDKSIDKTFQAYVSPIIKENSVRLFYKNGHEGVSISFKDEDGNTIYEENTQDDDMYAKKYNISQLKKGIYTLMLTCGDRTIEKIYKVE